MSLSRRSSWLITLMLLLLFAFVNSGHSQEDVSKFPSRPITFINPTAAGNPTSMAIRLLGHEAEKFLGQPVVEMNKPGGGLSIGLGALASAKPDGYTVGYAGHTGMYVTPLIEKVSYHPIRDFTPLLQWGEFNFAIGVRGDSPFKTFQDVITYARQNPKKGTYGTNGATSMQAIIVEQIAVKEKVDFTLIPFQGTSEFQTAILGGHIVFAAGDFNASLIESGQIRLLLLLKEKRSTEYPNVPILKDLGYDIPCPMTLNTFAPKNLPAAIAKKLEDAFARAVKEPAFIDGMKKLHIPIVYRSSKEVAESVARTVDVYSKFIKEMKLNP
jgi:tripartite-type tricarboxylate transporter receptor subunit TctC